MTTQALCIGINNYPGTHMDLAGCVNDANDWAEDCEAKLKLYQPLMHLIANDFSPA